MSITISAANIIVYDYRANTLYHNSAKSNLSTTSVTPWAGYETMNYVTCVQFTTTKIASSVTLSVRSSSSGGTNDDSSNRVYLKYKLLDTDNTSYHNAGASTASDGRFQWNGTDYGVNTITITRTIPAGTHYLYIWTGGSTSTVLNYGAFRFLATGTYATSLTMEELVGAVRISNGSSFDVYTVWIDNGTSWVQYIPYIDNGSSWDPCG